MAAVYFLHRENPPTWAGVEPAALGAEGQRQTNHATLEQKMKRKRRYNETPTRNLWRCCSSPAVKVSDHGRRVMSSSPVPLKTRRLGQRCTLNLSRAETSSLRRGVVVRDGGASSGVVHVTLIMVQNYVIRRQKPSSS
ncbi:uncharacterized protein TNCV_3243851 [Trichonephila clavipes]|nr:uncharacterized protein TNCV_3243851 [Trichonephila clavipes]